MPKLQCFALDLHQVVLHLGGFHAEMRFLRCKGHLIAGAGLEKLLEIIYTNNAVVHMLSKRQLLLLSDSISWWIQHSM